MVTGLLEKRKTAKRKRIKMVRNARVKGLKKAVKKQITKDVKMEQRSFASKIPRGAKAKKRASLLRYV